MQVRVSERSTRVIDQDATRRWSKKSVEVISNEHDRHIFNEHEHKNLLRFITCGSVTTQVHAERPAAV
jgi:hypothetical protein